MSSRSSSRTSGHKRRGSSSSRSIPDRAYFITGGTTYEVRYDELVAFTKAATRSDRANGSYQRALERYRNSLVVNESDLSALFAQRAAAILEESKLRSILMQHAKNIDVVV